MNLRAFIVLFLLLVVVYPLTVVVSVDDTKHAVVNQVEDTKLSTCKYGRRAKYELDQGVEGGLDEDESKNGGGIGRNLQRGGGDTERGGGGGDSSRGGGGGDRERGGGGGDRERGGGRGRRGRGGGRGGRGGWV